jgi:subtilisin family serine protease
VDVHAWGEKVVTLGYGDLFHSGEDQAYTATFSGTSSAAPIVVGAVASLQGAALAAGQGPIDPRALRALLSSTGTPQASGTQRIGSLPDLRGALPRLLAR